MEKIINDFLLNLNFGQAQTFKNMAVIPIFSKTNSSPQYLTLKEAMDIGVLTIEELSSSGSVPELKAINKGKMPILILDGEEIIGAKQNRVLNTTVLLKEESETIIPVSCTEQGRWDNTSAKFSDSDMITAQKVRFEKNMSVNKSLEFNRSFVADQSKVWSEIYLYQNDADYSSSTGAMRDVFEYKAESLNNYLDSFKFSPGQNGVFVFINGNVIGFDYVSLSTAYETLHLKLLKSYAMDAVLSSDDKDYNVSEEKAKELIDKLTNSNVKIFDSVGYGKDFRFTGKGLIASSLVWQENIIHMACFKIDNADNNDVKDIGRMSSYKRRMENRG